MDDDGEAAIGLYGLFGIDRWVSFGANTDIPALKNRFQTLLRGATINGADLLQAIPAGLTNTFAIEARTQRGFKFEWRDTAGVGWHGHEADAGAGAGHLGAAGWTRRVNCGKLWLLPTEQISAFPVGHANYAAPTHWKPINRNRIGDTHVPLTL
jgi:hypothetical protein